MAYRPALPLLSSMPRADGECSSPEPRATGTLEHGDDRTKVQTKQVWSDESQKPIFAFAPQIRCCIVFGPNRQRLKVAWRKGPVSLEPDNDIALTLDHAAICQKDGAFSTRYHGRTRALAVIGEKLILLAFPISNKVVMVTADPGFPLEKTDELGELLGRLCYWFGEPSAPAVGDGLAAAG